ncbi:MAG: hypothetical protein QOF72_1126 [Blastocatellia bacterium]|jgi:hypothetical protein|nr:hypothetical protein [Blastocatellia bacterium]MDX6575206.1 hypothetical protein [Blastocatellia bacterium]
MNLSSSELALAPLGAGDLIDRAVRLYRRHFLTLISIAAPPVLISALGSTITTIAWRELTITASDINMALYVLLLMAGIAIIISGSLFSIVVMGGATRTLVAHLLWSEPVTARATYRAVKSRFWGLLGASVLVALWLAFAALLGFMASMMVFAVAAAALAFASLVSGWLAVILWVLGTFAAIAAGAILFFFLAGRMAYVPQAMLVEGKTVFAAIGRSFSLASGNVRRLMAMTLFTSFGTYSALMLLMIPLGWYGYLNGVNVSPFGSTWPTWYAIGYQVILQCSHIMLAPIWMLGFSLLYVDERVRHEGYDIELMAARQLPEMPTLPGVVSPFAPALVTGRAPRFVPPPLGPGPPGSVLGLN